MTPEKVRKIVDLPFISNQKATKIANEFNNLQDELKAKYDQQEIIGWYYMTVGTDGNYISHLRLVRPSGEHILNLTPVVAKLSDKEYSKIPTLFEHHINALSWKDQPEE